MNGRPVWLASVSLEDRRGRTRPTHLWGPDKLTEASAGIDVLLAGVGDESREREFRMNVTLCRHRAVTQAELDALPDWWHETVAQDLAGGPLEVLWSRGIPDVPSTRPCVAPRRVAIDKRDFRLWIPDDCGECETCLARAACRPAS